MRLRQIGKELEAIDNKAGPAAAPSQPALEWTTVEKVWTQAVVFSVTPNVLI